MRKCAVIIGVNQTGHLPVLSGAVAAAESMAEWTLSQGYDTTLITDKHQAVGSADIFKAVRDFTEQNVYDQLLVYFAGHGILKDGTNELWLLSDSPENPNEAVNLIPSAFRAQGCGIPHVIFISDACRSLAEDLEISGMMGSVIFPSRRQGIKSKDVDIFYASQPGDPTFEVKVDDATQSYQCIFTSCLLKGLKGEEPVEITTINQPEGKISVIQGQQLKNYLKIAVPEAAAKVNIDLKLDPHAVVTSMLPLYITEVPPKTVGLTDHLIQPLNKLHTKFKNIENFPPPTHNERLKNKSLKTAAGTLSRLDDIIIPDNIATGFTISGISGDLNAYSVVGKEIRTEIYANNTLLIRVSEKALLTNTSFSLLFVFPDQTSVPLVLLNNFIGNVSIENGRVINISYFPSRFHSRYQEGVSHTKEINKRRALIAASARQGKFRPIGDLEQQVMQMSYLRNEKSLDPTLGLYAAYGFMQARDERAVESVYVHMAREDVPVLYDVAMLYEICKEHPEIIPPVAGFCPLLTQGWSLLLIGGKIPQPIEELSYALIPGLWTTLNPTGTRMAATFLNSLSR